MTTKAKKWLVILVALATVFAACGGGESDDAEGGGDDGDNRGGEGEIVVGGDLSLPDYFPADFYLPDSVTVRSVTESPSTNMMSLSGRYEGDADAVLADMVSGLQDAGYELLLQDDDVTVFIKDGVGRIRIRAREFLGEPTLTVDIDTWTDDQIAELRDLNAAEITVPGSATAQFGGDSLSAQGECILKGTKRLFIADDVSISIQIDETRDPVYLYADVTTPAGVVWTFDESAGSDYESSPLRLFATGQMYDYTGDAANIDFTIEATCDA